MPNIELLFTEAGTDPAARVRAAAAAGFDAVEMWGTLDKDVSALAKALSDSGVTLASVLAEPRTNFTLPGTDLGPFFEGLDRGVKRGQPGSGAIDWLASLAVLRAAGYAGPIWLEYFPTEESGQSLELIKSLAATA